VIGNLQSVRRLHLITDYGSPITAFTDHRLLAAFVSSWLAVEPA
jgi:hypothetical protein